MRFRDRVEAGELLGAHLLQLGLPDPVVLGLPRGGVVVAAEVAKLLGVAADVFIVRKIGHPQQRELGLGAISEGGQPRYDEQALARYQVTVEDLAPVVAAERLELDRRISTYRGNRPLLPLAGRHVVLVDDGLATGVTARAAAQALAERRPARLVFAAPVGPDPSGGRLADHVDDVVILHTPRHFAAVGQAYDDFREVSDEVVLRLLREPI